MAKLTAKTPALLAILVVAGLAFLFFWMVRGQREVGENAKADLNPIPTSRLQPNKGAESYDINDVLQLWAEEHKGRAVALFLELVNRNPPRAAFRPSNLSEEEFVRLPTAEREQLKVELIATFKQARAFAKEIELRGNDALAKGDREQARKLFEGLKQFGSANTGPENELTKLANLLGQAIVQLAERGLGAMKEPGPDGKE